MVHTSISRPGSAGLHGHAQRWSHCCYQNTFLGLLACTGVRIVFACSEHSNSKPILHSIEIPSVLSLHRVRRGVPQFRTRAQPKFSSTVYQLPP